MAASEIVLNVFKCLTVSLYLLNSYFGNSTVLFISVAIPCEFAIVQDLYILLSPQQEEVHFSS